MNPEGKCSVFYVSFCVMSNFQSTPSDREALLEQENRERTERLAAKVAALKNVSKNSP